MPGQRETIQQLLSAPDSPLRDELLALGFDALAAQPLAQLAAPDALARVVASALTRDNAKRISEQHVVSGFARVTQALAARGERLGELLTPEADQSLRRMLVHKPAPKLAWLRGALDPEDFRQLLAPVVQQVLLQFTTKLPIFNAPAGGGSGGGGLGGLVGMLGKQVQKSAGQLADVGRSVMSGLGGEFERRMQAVARDFSQTATADFRAALIDRLRSDEGKQIMARMRDRVVQQVLAARLGEVASDVALLPVAEGALFTGEILHLLGEAPWFTELLQHEIAGVMQELGQRSLRDVLIEAGLLDAAREQIQHAVAPGIRALAQSDAFGAWLDRLLDASKQP